MHDLSISTFFLLYYAIGFCIGWWWWFKNKLLADAFIVSLFWIPVCIGLFFGFYLIPKATKILKKK